VDFSVMTQRALAVRAAYEDYESREYGRSWTLEELTLGLVGDIGDLAKLIQAHEGVREIAGAAAGLEHELADVLWSVIVIADRCNIDLTTAFVNTMDLLQANLATEASGQQ
jgi:NTP pyrophosphatase (non-canonical NTP hydrolase)